MLSIYFSHENKCLRAIQIVSIGFTFSHFNGNCEFYHSSPYPMNEGDEIDLDRMLCVQLGDDFRLC